MIFTGCTLNII